MTPVLIVLIVMSFAAIMAKWGMDHDLKMKRIKRGQDPDNPDNSLRLSELQEMIRVAVKEANTGLEARLDALEERLDRQEKQLPPAPDRRALEEHKA